MLAEAVDRAVRNKEEAGALAARTQARDSSKGTAKVCRFK
jgi:hypothetical protein